VGDLRDVLSPRTLGEMEAEVIRKGGSFDVPHTTVTPHNRKQKKEKR
jgi:hypothetical protein